MSEPFLNVQDIHTYYDRSHILQGISLNIAKGEIVCLLGRNGVGKTTTLKSIMGLTPPKSGSVKFQGREIAGKTPHEIAQLGLGYIPEERRIFPRLTVKENLIIAKKNETKSPNSWTLNKVYEFFPALERLTSHRGMYLSGGEQQMLALARTLMGNPDLILVDEPTEGLAPLIVQAVKEVILKVKEDGVTVLLVEQNMKVALSLASRAYVMSKGLIFFHGSSDELWANQEIRRRYLEV